MTYRDETCTVGSDYIWKQFRVSLDRLIKITGNRNEMLLFSGLDGDILSSWRQEKKFWFKLLSIKSERWEKKINLFSFVLILIRIWLQRTWFCRFCNHGRNVSPASEPSTYTTRLPPSLALLECLSWRLHRFFVPPLSASLNTDFTNPQLVLVVPWSPLHH